MSLEIKRVKLDAIHQDPANARKHGQRNIEAIRGSLKQFGQVEPLVVQKSTGKVVGGNGRVEAMRLLGMHEADVVEVDIDNVQATALGLALNRTGELAEWDHDVLGKLAGELRAQDFDLDGLGFSDRELRDVLGDDDGPVEEDDVPDPPNVAVTQPGDLWVMGRHQLLCGDSTNRNDVAVASKHGDADACITDPPYNVGIAFGKHDDDQSQAELLNFTGSWFEKVPCSLRVVTIGIGYNALTLALWMRHYPPVWIAIWLRTNSMSHSPLRGFNAWEPILIYGKCPKPIGQDIFDFPVGRQRDVEDSQGNKLHPTPKPVKLWMDLVAKFTDEGAVLYEPFAGSGTTVIAAEKLGRSCYSLELEPKYCDVIIERWENLTGGKARRVRHG